MAIYTCFEHLILFDVESSVIPHASGVISSNKFGSVAIGAHTNEDLERLLVRKRVIAIVLIAAAVTLVGAGLCPGYSIQEGPAMLGNVTLRLV